MKNIVILGLVLIVFGFLLAGLLTPAQNNTATQGADIEISEENMVNTQELQVETTEEGTGEEVVESGDDIVIHYEGRLTDGTVFDSSYEREEPFQTQIGAGEVIPGWDEGIVGMKVGEKRQLTIPPHMAYGAQGTPDGTIPPNSTLVFDVELIEILK